MLTSKALSRRAFLAASTVALTGAALGFAAQPQSSMAQATSAPQRYLEGELALSGYDPVAYFTDGKPVEGSANLEAVWDGATWRFANTDYKRAFLENPEKYAPQYGGFCAYAVSQGYTASADPHAWSIVDDKLYVNYNKAVRGLWNLRRSHYIKQGDQNWPSVLG